MLLSLTYKEHLGVNRKSKHPKRKMDKWTDTMKKQLTKVQITIILKTHIYISSQEIKM